jgi:hypothetical protein
MSKPSIAYPEPQASMLPVPEQGLWPRLRGVGTAWMHRLVEVQMSAMRGCVLPTLGLDDAMPREFGRLPRRLWQRHSAYLVYGQQARTLAPEPGLARSGHGGDIEATRRSA